MNIKRRPKWAIYYLKCEDNNTVRGKGFYSFHYFKIKRTLSLLMIHWNDERFLELPLFISSPHIWLIAFVNAKVPCLPLSLSFWQLVLMAHYHHTQLYQQPRNTEESRERGREKGGEAEREKITGTCVDEVRLNCLNPPYQQTLWLFFHNYNYH